MSFGASSGPPASAKQVAYLESLLEQAGWSGFREARHPFGLTQRQANGKFTKQEASDLIDRLLAADGTDPEADEPPPRSDQPLSAAAQQRARRAADRLDAERAAVVQGMPAEVLAAELQRRGWAVSPPPQ